MNEIYFRANSHGTQPKKLDNFPVLKGINARIPFVANSKIIGGSRPSDKGGRGAVIQTLRIGGSGLKKMFRPFGPQFREKWGGGAPLDPPLKMVDELNPLQNPTQHTDTSRVVQKAQLDQNQYLWSGRPGFNSEAQRI